MQSHLGVILAFISLVASLSVERKRNEIAITRSREATAWIAAEEQVTIILSSHDPLVDGYAEQVLHQQDGMFVNGLA